MQPVRIVRAPYRFHGQHTLFFALLVALLSLPCFGQSATTTTRIQDATEIQPPEVVLPAVFPDLPPVSTNLPVPIYTEVLPDRITPPVNLPAPAVLRKLKKFDARHDLDKIGARGMGEGFNFYSRDFEFKEGRDYAKQIDAQVRLVQDSAIEEYVNRIAQNIVSHSDAKLTFITKLIDDSEINAFCLPGGFLYVNTGLIEQTDSEAALAGVIAHEVGHVAARHAARNESRNLLMSILLAATAAALHGRDRAQTATVIVGNVAIPLTVLHFSRKFEEEADLLALQYLYAAGYDPGAYVSFFEAIEKKRKSNRNFFVKLFSFHPPTSLRILHCQRILEAYFPDKPAYALTTDEFDSMKARLSLLLGAKRFDEGHEEKEPVLQRRTPRPTDESDERHDSAK